MIPTFLGATLLVFTILQMAPGGPLDKTIQQMQSGGASSGASQEGGTSGNSNIGGSLIPKRALKELERFYGFDKPILQRYLIWLGVWEREIKHKTLIFNFHESEKKKNMGKRRYAHIMRNGSNLEVYDKDGNISKLWKARFDMDISEEEIANINLTLEDEHAIEVFNKEKNKLEFFVNSGNLIQVYDEEKNLKGILQARFDVNISEQEKKYIDYIIESDQEINIKTIEFLEQRKDKKIIKTIHEDKKIIVLNTSPVTIGKLFEIKELEGTIYETEFSGVLTGNLGKSYTYQQPVTDVMKPRFRVSIMLGLTGWIIAYLVCIPLGIKKALSHGSRFDLISSAIVFMAYSIPGWAFGGVLLVLFGGGSFWDVFPLGGLHSPQSIWQNMNFFEKVIDQIWHAILPIIAWTIGSFASLTVLMKNSLLDNMSQDYIRTAFAKGLTERRVIWVHAMRNSIIPIASGIGYIIATIIAGSYFIEWIFNIDGFGKMGYQAILDRDYPITMGFLVVAVLIRLVANLLSDLALALVDPRIRFK